MWVRNTLSSRESKRRSGPDHHLRICGREEKVVEITMGGVTKIKKGQGSKGWIEKENREAKKECWVKWIEVLRQVWYAVRLVQNPFGLRTRATTLTKERGEVSRTVTEAFIEHNLITGPHEEAQETPIYREKPATEIMQRVHRVLRHCKNKVGTRTGYWGKIKALMNEKKRALMWVKGHSGNHGSETADRAAKETVDKIEGSCPTL